MLKYAVIFAVVLLALPCGLVESVLRGEAIGPASWSWFRRVARELAVECRE